MLSRRRKRRRKDERMTQAMKLSMILGLVLGNILAFGSQAKSSNEPAEGSAWKQDRKQLELTVVTDRYKYRRHGKIKVSAMLTNVDYVKDIFLYNRLGWGYLSSFTYTIRDASGKRVQPTILADDLPLPIAPNDTTAFVKLPPDQFLGIHYAEELDRLNISRPGKYSIFVEYHCPISTSEVELKPFWGKENGTLRSNVVWIEVTP